MGRLRSALAALSLMVSAGALACYWDYDTLAEEAKGENLDDVSIIVGRFERNPPLYYEMRLERVAKLIPKDPNNFNLYDDAGVAADRLGRHDEAIEWMKKKWKVMRPHYMAISNFRNPNVYRYHANSGTFWAHKWAASKERKKEWLETAKRHIESAIDIDPDAHFGREMYQLLAIQWILAEGKMLGRDVNLSEYLEGYDDMLQQPPEKRREGLAGLVRLGNGWRSPDLMFAYANSLSKRQVFYNEALRYLGHLRTRELVEEGAKSLFPESFYLNILTDSPAMVFPHERSHTEGEFEKLRENAERWHQKRTEFMLSQLRKGKHPDTHSDFWTGYAEIAPYQITYRPLSFDERLHRGERGAQIIVFSLFGGILVAGAVGGVALLRGGRRFLRSRST